MDAAIGKNEKRLLAEEYQIGQIFRPEGYGWPGDWEGRALLAFLCHFEMTGRRNPCLTPFTEQLPARLNENGCLGKPRDVSAPADEQMLSGHNWLLRGLIRYAELFSDRNAAAMAERIFENLYLPVLDRYEVYPASERKNGGVSGETVGKADGWLLSGDVGCAYMCLDGVSRYYALSSDPRAKKWFDRAAEIFARTDIEKAGFQTHASLSAARGVLKMYESTGDERYLGTARALFDRYLRCGMTLTYENTNWFGRPDSWTEPCAVVDSLMLAVGLFRSTGEGEYRTLARRILFNGLSFCQRENGGAGPNTCVTVNTPELKIFMYEAPFCCTMRYAEGLLTAKRNAALFSFDPGAKEETDRFGRHFKDDLLIVKNGDRTVPLFSCRDIPEEEAKKLTLKVLW
ncbi:MAG: glycoside hydrolase family 127 protein [Lachnospiraceae bacterium]|nr:glycoside hydrolase family 127 protein [Lachnospiraceae bacterium]